MASTSIEKEIEIKEEELKLYQGYARKFPEENEESEKEIKKREADLRLLYEKRKMAEEEASSTPAPVEPASTPPDSQTEREEQAAGVASLAGPEGAVIGAALAADAARKRAKAEAKAQKKSAGSSKPGVFTRMKSGYNKANDDFVQFQRDAKKVLNKTHIFFFALFALLIHVYDAYSGFSRGAGSLSILVILYTVLTLWAVFGYYKTWFTPESLRYIFISIVAIVLPILLQIPFLSTFIANDYLKVLLTLLPIWFLYIGFNEENGWPRVAAKILILLLVIGFVLILIMKVSFPDLLPDRGINLGGPFQRVWTDLKDAWTQLKERFASGGLFSPKTWKKKFNTTFNPYAQFYTGQVEENQEEPTGVFITELKSLYPVTYTRTDPVLLGHIEAKTFLPYTVTLTPSCILERAGRGSIYGKPNPDPGDHDSEPLELNYKLQRDVTCIFPAEEKNISAGSYYGIMGITFPYETWSYITETFVSRQLIESYLSQGRDINTDLDIAQKVSTVYTNGPVEIGVLSADQPIDINLNAKNSQFIQQRFGFTVANRWNQGKIERGTVSAIVMVPKPFQLKDCKPTEWSNTAETEQYTNYTFDRNNANWQFDEELDKRLDYSTVTCQLILPDKQAAEQVLSFGEKTPVTFVVIAKYNYAIEKKIPVKVSD